MSAFVEPAPDVGIRTAEIVWGASEEASQGQQQEHGLRELIELSSRGLIIDCGQVECGDLDLVDLLMRVRSHATGRNKHLALFNVPRSLKSLIVSHNLRLALPVFKNAASASKLVAKLANFSKNA